MLKPMTVYRNTLEPDHVPLKRLAAYRNGNLRLNADVHL